MNHSSWLVKHRADKNVATEISAPEIVATEHIVNSFGIVRHWDSSKQNGNAFIRSAYEVKQAGVWFHKIKRVQIHKVRGEIIKGIDVLPEHWNEHKLKDRGHE